MSWYMYLKHKDNNNGLLYTRPCGEHFINTRSKLPNNFIMAPTAIAKSEDTRLKYARHFSYRT